MLSAKLNNLSQNKTVFPSIKIVNKDCVYIRRMENYQEAEWSSAVGLEDHYKNLEANYAQQFGDHQDEEGISYTTYQIQLQLK